MRILVVEDDPDLGEALQRQLRRDGYAVDWEQDGGEADEILRYQGYELIVLDVSLPGRDGFDILQRLRGRGTNTPVLMLTALADVKDRVTALDVGADDYVSKPFDFRELYARCRVLLRRSQGIAQGQTTVGGLTFDRAGRTARIGNTRLALPNREFRLLEIFVGNLGKAMSKAQILSQLFDFDDVAGENAIELYVGRLRKKLAGTLNIRTVHGFGYVAEEPSGIDQ